MQSSVMVLEDHNMVDTQNDENTDSEITMVSG